MILRISYSFKDKGGRNMRVMIDAGHGGYDPGATSNGLKEKDLTLKLALDVAEDLESLYGIEVLLTRTEDVFISLEDRVLKANTAEVDYFVSLHHNAGGGTGFESYIYPGYQQTQTGVMQERLHQWLSTFYQQYMIRDRGRKQADFYVLRHTLMPAILLENLFVDTLDDASFLKDPVFLRQLATEIAKGIYQAVA